jgi:hypothetical protein
MDLTRTKNAQLLSLIKAAQAELRRRGRDSVTGKRLTKKTR